MNKYLVYKLTSPCGKAYIGRTKNYAKRSNDHKNGNKCRLLQEAIQTFGWSNIKQEILRDGLTLEEANHWEKFYIKYHNTFEPNGFNMQTGGTDCKYSQSVSKKISDKKKGKPSWNKGKKNSPEHVKKSADARRGKKQKPETIENRRLKLIGQTRSKEFKERMRKINIGRKFTPETLKRMSEGQKRRFAKHKESSDAATDHK